MQPLDPRLGSAAGINSDFITGKNPPPPDPMNQTVGEYLRETIQHLHAQIKTVEGQYMEARQLGLLDCKVRALRNIISW